MHSNIDTYLKTVDVKAIILYYNIRLVQSKRSPNGNWPDLSYGYGQLAETFSFPTVYHSIYKSDF